MSVGRPKMEPSVVSHPTIAKAISRGLHEMAQPLTALQGALELALMQSEGGPAETHHSLELARKEVARVCASLEHVRSLVRLQLAPEDLSQVAASQILKVVLERLHSQFSQARIQATVSQPPDLDDRVSASVNRIREAFLLVLSSALTFLPTGGCVVAGFASDQNLVSVKLQFLPADGRKPYFTREIPRELELAQAMLVAAAGEVLLGDVPFSLEIRLPRASAEAKSARV